MTANKILNIGKAGVKVSWALVMLLATVLFIIVSGFFKIFVTVAELGSDEDDLFENDKSLNSETSMVVGKNEFSGRSHRYDMGADKDLVIFDD